MSDAMREAKPRGCGPLLQEFPHEPARYQKAAELIVHAALMPPGGPSPQRAWTLPATVVRLETLFESLGRRLDRDLRITYGDRFVDQPPLVSEAAFAVGFISDGDTDALVDAVVTRIERG